MAGSVIPAAIDAIVSSLKGNTFEVFDGPGLSDAALQSAVFIGLSDIDETGFTQAASTDQSWAWLGHNMRDENASIQCLAFAWSGDAEMKFARDTVFATLTKIAQIIQADPTLGGAVLQVVGVKSGQYRQNQTEDGSFAELTFEIQIRGRVN